MESYKSRDEIDKKYKWDIESVYSSDDDWESDFQKAQTMIEAFTAFKGRLLEDSGVLLAALKADSDIDRLISKVYLYAKMRLDENTADTKYQALVSRAESLATKASEAASFFTPEIMSAEEKALMLLIDSSEELQLYRHFFDNMLRRKPHTLSESEEQLLAMTSEITSAPQTIFSMLNLADFKFGDIEDDKGKKVKLSHGNFVPFMESKDRSVREKVFKQYYDVFMSHKNSIGAMIHSEVKGNIFYSKARKYESARNASLFRNNVDVSVYDNLIKAVNKNIGHMHKYISVRKKALALDEMHMYDIYVPLISETDYKIPYEEAEKTVLDALAPLGDEYVGIVKKSFEDRWIDVYESEGKRSGAYSWGTYDTKPFMMLNYYGTLDNMFTLAHEMGHSLHSYLTRTRQPHVYGDYSIFLAEVASTTNEALLTEYLLGKETDRAKRLYILNHYLDQFRGTVYRQTMFAEFELKIHEIVEGGGALNADVLSGLYLELNRKYYGDDVIHDEEIKYEWTRIPHFYYNFYVFQYATGFSAAVALARGILEEGDAAREKYINFLSSGSSRYPLDILKDAGADMLSPEPVEKALELFGRLVDEFEKELFSE